MTCPSVAVWLIPASYFRTPTSSSPLFIRQGQQRNPPPSQQQSWPPQLLPPPPLSPCSPSAVPRTSSHRTSRSRARHGCVAAASLASSMAAAVPHQSRVLLPPLRPDPTPRPRRQPPPPEPRKSIQLEARLTSPCRPPPSANSPNTGLPSSQARPSRSILPRVHKVVFCLILSRNGAYGDRIIGVLRSRYCAEIGVRMLPSMPGLSCKGTLCTRRSHNNCSLFCLSLRFPRRFLLMRRLRKHFPAFAQGYVLVCVPRL